MRLESPRVESVPAAPAAQPAMVCPRCGERMTPSRIDRARIECLACGQVQKIETLSPTALERQRSHLHTRGIDRLLAAIVSPKEPS